MALYVIAASEDIFRQWCAQNGHHPDGVTFVNTEKKFIGMLQDNNAKVHSVGDWYRSWPNGLVSKGMKYIVESELDITWESWP